VRESAYRRRQFTCRDGCSEVQGSALAVAVCNAGGLGSLPCAMLSVEVLRKELAAIKAQTAMPSSRARVAEILSVAR
jgi:NAD(P)H-dependent flavin oxidoreductase YrpB (nitropropane dioxygenase family)